ncbi:prepilin-type N-terminal cleavage/methylation domain-containing protein [uncultured Tolumonas sp.]|uniref:pilin n=1 Tax=uncultured Tolumonas sp. TaxID=263765 RepID=UPI0029308A16|nr:prepilin-type N-terminal cleavage/methylation domain-containing protein [uncultured Tolumonas sp.]
MKKQSGFTLIELMIVVAIVAILAAIAMPAYQTYTNKARFTEVISAVGPYKTAIELCVQSQGNTTTIPNECVQPGQNGIPADKITADAPGTGHVGTVQVDTTTGAITATATDIFIADGTTVANYVITPANTNGKISWLIDTDKSNCDDAAYCTQ